MNVRAWPRAPAALSQRGTSARAPASPLDQARPRTDSVVWLSLLGAAGLHALCLAGAQSLVSIPRELHRRAHVASTQMFDVELAQPARAPAPALPEPSVAAVAARVHTVRAASAPRAPAPATAQAAQVLAEEPESEVMDFGETFVQGRAAGYAGGTSEATGSAAQAVHDDAARSGAVDGATGKAARGLDLSRAPALASGVSWHDCPFPEEADALGIDEAHVTLRVHVATSGAVTRVDVVDDPGAGFAREARRCALQKRWQAGLDRAGSALASSALIKVRFTR